jgi:O-antigen/teichoic acid export membrane protein
VISFLKRKINNLLSDKNFSEIVTGSAYALSARVGGTGVELVASVIIARFYGAEVMGIVAVINSFLLLATIFTVLGTNTSILRLIPEQLVTSSATSAFRVYRKTQYLVIGVSVFTGILFFFGAKLIADKVFSKPDLSFYFSLAAVFIVFKSLMLLNTHAVRGLKLIKVFAIMQLLPQSFNVILLILLGLLWPSKDVPFYALLGGFALTGLVGWAIMEYSFRRIIQPQDAVETVPVRKILSISLPMLMTQTMTFLIGQTGVIALGIFKTEAEVGYYAIAVKMATLTTFILTAINSMAAPKFSELFYAGRMDDLFHIARKSSRLIFWSDAPVLIGLVLLGKPILSILFGANFAVGYLPLVLLAIGQFVNSISGSTGLFMNMTGHQVALGKILLCSALINIVMNLILTPSLGMNGAAVGAMMSLSFWNIYTLLYIKRKYGRTIGYFPLPLGFSKRSL